MLWGSLPRPSDSGVTALLSTSSNPGVIHVWPFFFRVPFKRLSCEEGACRFCAKWLVWDRADHISSEGDRSLVGRAFGSSANSASRGVGDRPLSSGALTHGPSGQRQRQCQYRVLFLPSRAAFNRGLGAAFVVVITTAAGLQRRVYAALTHRLPRASRGPVGWCAVLRHVCLTVSYV